MSDRNIILENLRVRYQSSELDFKDCSKDPVLQFNHWLDQAIDSQCDEPNAFILSTVSNDQPRSRVVLLKGIKDNQFVFYTNYSSAKGHEISLNQKVAMTFLWLPLQRQVRIEGIVSKIDNVSSDEYFRKRPRGSQIGAIASPQSQKVSSRKELEDLFKITEEKFIQVQDLPRPKNWGGYAISPTYLEFWQGRDNRLHDRICFEKKNNEWEIYRLAP